MIALYKYDGMVMSTNLFSGRGAIVKPVEVPSFSDWAATGAKVL
jgi:hypothetical protein